MITINLLPWREKKRISVRKTFLHSSFLLIALMAVIFLVWHLLLNEEARKQIVRNDYLTRHIQEYDGSIERIAQLQTNQKNLLKQIDVLQSLINNRFFMIRLFNMLNSAVPDNVYFTLVRREKNRLTIEGNAKGNTAVTEVMQNIRREKWLSAVTLQRIKADTKNPLLHHFELNLELGNTSIPENNSVNQ